METPYEDTDFIAAMVPCQTPCSPICYLKPNCGCAVQADDWGDQLNDPLNG